MEDEMTEAMFYLKMAEAVSKVKMRAVEVSIERTPTGRDYMIASIEEYRKMNLKLYPILILEGSIVDCIFHLAVSEVQDPVLAGMMATSFMRRAWEHYENETIKMNHD